MIDISILHQLNAPDKETRLENLARIVKETAFPEAVPQYINNHIHTTYSFSPYSPAAAVYAARAEGLCTAGIIDHDSIAGAREFLAAAKIIGMPVTVGMEARISMAGTILADRRTNNPDQKGVSYMTIQSVPHDKIEDLQAYFEPYRKARGERNRVMVSNINREIPGIALDYEKDVLPESMARDGGGVTERHLLFALSKKLVKKYGKGQPLLDALTGFGISLSEKQKAQLLDTAYPFYEYDMLGMFKGGFIERIYVPADKECPLLSEIVGKCREIDAYLCYAYLGDIGESVTGDKKAQKFEDDYLEDVFDCLRENGVRCITYMPTRNTREQLLRLRELCDRYDMFQISGEDINSPRQGFVIRAMEDPLFSNLIDSTWKLIEHEKE